MRLQRLDFAAAAALQHHRFEAAARARDEADALEQGECRDAGLRLNGETARLQLVLRGRARLDTLRAKLAQLAAEGRPSRKLYVDFVGAAATVAEDRARGEAALRQVIAAADAHPGAAFAPLVRDSAFDVLTDAAAGAGTGDAGRARAVLGLVAERLRAAAPDRCALGIASWSRLVVAALDAQGRPALDIRDIPEGEVMIPSPEAVSSSVRAHLAGCRRVEVVAPGPYLGAPGLLGDGVAWVYATGHTAHATAAGQLGPAPAHGSAGRSARGHELIVSGVAPPEDLHLPALAPFEGGDGAETLSGASATPSNVLAAMATASLAIIVAHGVTDASEPTAASLILSPDARGDYLLTASKVRSAALTAAPIVILAGCDAGRVQVSAEPWSLATSFIAAGARMVIAPTEPIPDASASEVFRALVERIRAGVDPLDALIAERRARGAAAAWLSSIVVFE